MVLLFPNFASTYRYYFNKMKSVFAVSTTGLTLDMQFTNPQGIFELDMTPMSSKV